MSAHRKQRKPTSGSQDRLTPEEFERLVAEAQKRGEPTGPLIKRLVLQTIEEVKEQSCQEPSSELVN